MKAYLDHVATTKPLPQVVKAMQPYFSKQYGNPQSFHDVGAKPSEAIEKARLQVSSLINAEKPGEVFFTSCGTESNNLALKGVAYANKNKGKHIIVSSTEHFSVLYSAQFLETMGFEVTFLPVDREGLVDPGVLEKELRKDTILVSVHHANNEVGTIEPIKELAEVAKKHGAYFHTDAVASTGHIKVDVEELGVDLLSMSAHRFYGPKGAGALYIRDGTRIHPVMHGGIQENGRRAGTENVPGIVGMGKAAELAQKDDRVKKLMPLRKKLAEGLEKKVEHLVLNGPREKVLPTHVSVCIQYIEGEGVLAFLNEEGVYCASGSACTSKALKASHVLTAMGLDHAIAQGSILFSIGIDNKPEEINYVLKVFPPIVKRLRQISPLWREKFGN